MNKKGSVLILSLWVIVVLSTLAVSLAQSTRQKMLILKRLEGRDHTRRLVEAAIKKLTLDLETFKQGSLDAAQQRQLSELLRGGRLTIGGETVAYEISDESQRINLNRVNPDNLKQLFQNAAHLGEESAAKLAFSIKDYVDTDDFISEFFDQGSEKGAYQAAGLAHSPKNNELEFLSELLLVKGMTQEIYNSIPNYITIYGDGSLNINTCSEEALLASDLDPGLANKIISVRKGNDLKEGTADDFIFTDLNNLESELLRFYPLSQTEQVSLSHALTHERISISPGNFRIIARSITDGQNGAAKTTCVFSPSSGIRYWHEA